MVGPLDPRYAKRTRTPSPEPKRERKAIFVIIALFVILLILLFFTFKRPEGPGHSPAESPIVKQRIINLQKSK